MTRFRSINKRLHGQRGTVVILFALFLPVFLGLAAFAIDLARLNLNKVELQNAADAAALAGACKYAEPTDSLEAKAEAKRVAKENYVNGVPIPDTYVTLSAASVPGYTCSIKVTIDSGPMNYFFARIWGIASSSDVQASAIAAQSPSKPGHSILVQ